MFPRVGDDLRLFRLPFTTNFSILLFQANFWVFCAIRRHRSPNPHSILIHNMKQLEIKFLFGINLIVRSTIANTMACKLSTKACEFWSKSWSTKNIFSQAMEWSSKVWTLIALFKMEWKLVSIKMIPRCVSFSARIRKFCLRQKFFQNVRDCLMESRSLQRQIIYFDQNLCCHFKHPSGAASDAPPDSPEIDIVRWINVLKTSRASVQPKTLRFSSAKAEKFRW